MENNKDNFLKSFKKDYGVIATTLIIIIAIIIPIIIWICLLFKLEKGAEDSWTIGVGLFGSLIGGICTLIAFLISNYQTKNIQNQNINLIKGQFYEDKRINVKPFLKVKVYDDYNTGKFNEIVALNKEKAIKVKDKKDEELRKNSILLNIDNIGLGPAINIKVYKINIDKGFDVNLEGIDNNISSISTGSNGCLEIYLEYLEDIDYLSKFTFSTEEEAIKKFKESDFKIYLNIEFEDILGNLYEKEICILCNKCIKTEKKIIVYRNLNEKDEKYNIKYTYIKSSILKNECNEYLKKKNKEYSF